MKENFELLRHLLKIDRSIRRYKESYQIDFRELKEIIGLTRFCASGRNLQPLKYYVINGREQCEKVFPLLKWAGYLTDWDGPAIGERPSAYIVQCLDTTLTNNCLCDDGLQLQAITLGATAKGLGCCIIKSFNSVKLKEVLNIPDVYQPLYVVSLGKPIEEIVIEPMVDNREESIKYYRTPDMVHHVPKRSVDELIISNQ